MIGLFFEIKIIPNSGKQKFILDESKQLKCYLKSQPEKGKANEELITLFSKQLKIPKNKVVVVSGKKSRNKRIKLDIEISFENLLKKLIEFKS